MSVFSSVDAAGDPDRVLRYLDRTAQAESGIKHYVMAPHALRRPLGPILDLGCGAGHDLALLNSAGLRTVGVDPSAVLLRSAAERTVGSNVGLVRGIGEKLPSGDGSFDGCRIERVLLHVADPFVVISEAVRCLRPGALITVFEPDWSEFRVRDDWGEQRAGWIAGMRHPGVGGALWHLLEEAGCDVVDRVEELSVWRSLGVLDAVIGLEASLERAVRSGRIAQPLAEQWLASQRSREERGEFFATAPKVLIVGAKR